MQWRSFSMIQNGRGVWARRPKASIDWDHLDTTDSTGDLGSLINLARPRGLHVSAAADEIFEVEEKLTGLCVCRGTAAQVHRWLREKPIGEQTR